MNYISYKTNLSLIKFYNINCIHAYIRTYVVRYVFLYLQSPDNESIYVNLKKLPSVSGDVPPPPLPPRTRTAKNVSTE